MREVSDDTRLVFQGWSDSAEPSRVITLSGPARTYTAVYVRQNRLSVEATPAEGATFAISPSSPDGFYDEGVTGVGRSQARVRLQHMGWTGDIPGSSTTAALTHRCAEDGGAAAGPRPCDLAIRRAECRDPASADNVAPGSLISIFGANLAPETQAGPEVRWPKRLKSVTVRADDTFLPLVFVSPGQINAQIPASISEGNHKITVRWEGKPEASAPVSVVRNAPGSSATDNRINRWAFSFGPTAARFRKIVLPIPAKSSLFWGQAWDRTTILPPDGFLLDEALGYTLADPVTVLVGEDAASPAICGQVERCGRDDAVRFQVAPVCRTLRLWRCGFA